ncbi:Fpg/Nei family DNA glycosylase [Cellulomonas gilvus]|uniref:DNA-formamidopyrimidine glycosylase n=1 Tax=Cellulomonas gilvus (strain ATCC 13127 / NRRL B-14078) TaxID=593907 RepID=F7ZZU2_CELGA|nr:DNA-formamidopyrimidine glycosylase family protein [Cellulomonas gilvus]AEI12585.1 DNA-formamidopyrimidine glycosylase [Cellulomonas gilvus ATCC 13127]
MPELPEVEALAGFLRERAVGRTVTQVGVGDIAALKTFRPPPDALVGGTVVDASRHGKWLDLLVATPTGEPLHLVWHLSRAGWVRWSDQLATTPVRPGRSPLALRVRLDDGSGFDLTEQGTRKRLAVHVVDDPQLVPQIASLGVEPLSAQFTRERFGELVTGRNQQIKGLLRDQGTIAGIGNAYSDEILHAARTSPFALTGKLGAAQVDVLYASIRDVLDQAVAAASGKPAAQLKDAKRQGMRVHGRTGQPCPGWDGTPCGDTVHEVAFADSSLQYCPTCQTGGKPLADRRMSRLLR